jgi:hypothetical protein
MQGLPGGLMVCRHVQRWREHLLHTLLAWHFQVCACLWITLYASAELENKSIVAHPLDLAWCIPVPACHDGSAVCIMAAALQQQQHAVDACGLL